MFFKNNYGAQHPPSQLATFLPWYQYFVCVCLLNAGMFAFSFPALNPVKHATVMNYILHFPHNCLMASVSRFDRFGWGSCFLCFMFWSGTFLWPADGKFFACEVALLWQLIVFKLNRTKFCISIASHKVHS